MQRRRIGQTGMEASVLGLGCEHLDGKPYAVVEDTMHAALEQGINIFDVFMPGEAVRKNIGKALLGQRENVLLQGHIGSVDLHEQYDISRDLAVCKRYFENLLRDLQTDYIDFGMLFFIDSEQDFDRVFQGDILRYAQKLKQDGRIRAIGASSHKPLVAKKIVDSGAVELLMFSINPAFDMAPPSENVLDTFHKDFKNQQYAGIRPDRQELYQLCESRGVAITVMKTLGGGKLLSPAQTPFAKPLTVPQCIHYALTRPGVVSALVGCQSRAQVLDAARYEALSDGERDYAEVVGSFQTFAGNCVYCGHCRPCPSHIDIASVHRYLDIARVNDVAPPGVLSHYQALTAPAGDCIFCGACEERCPFGVSIMENMKSALAIFGR